MSLKKKSEKKSKFRYVLPEKDESENWRKMYFDIWKRMQEFVFEIKPKLILELGTNSGFSTRIFLEALMQTGRGHLVTVDINESKLKDSQMEKYKGYFTSIQCDSLDLNVENKEIDILYIDSLHEYQHVLKELELYVPKVRKGGKVLLHDVSKPDNEAKPENQIPRIESNNTESKKINKAINEFLTKNKYRYEVILGHSGLGVIHVD